jgi:hypothetical protein
MSQDIVAVIFNPAISCAMNVWTDFDPAFQVHLESDLLARQAGMP